MRQQVFRTKLGWPEFSIENYKSQGKLNFQVLKHNAKRTQKRTRSESHAARQPDERQSFRHETLKQNIFGAGLKKQRLKSLIEKVNKTHAREH